MSVTGIFLWRNLEKKVYVCGIIIIVAPNILLIEEFGVVLTQIKRRLSPELVVDHVEYFGVVLTQIKRRVLELVVDHVEYFGGGGYVQRRQINHHEKDGKCAIEKGEKEFGHRGR
jgi:hypothetical protein